jgi:hypothetical protein
MPHPDINEDITELCNAINGGANVVGTATANRLGNKLRRKVQRINIRYNINLSSVYHTYLNNPQNLPNLLSIPDLKLLLKRDIEIAYERGINANNICYKAAPSNQLKVVRTDKNFIVKNLYLLNSKPNSKICIQSWSRPKSISQKHNKHLPTSPKNKHKSKFFGNVDYKKAEYLLFKLGVGLFDSINQIFFYAKFDKYIGNLPNGIRTKYLKMLVDRVPRPKGTGYRVEMHSYPVSFNEIQSL